MGPIRVNLIGLVNAVLNALFMYISLDILLGGSSKMFRKLLL
jgi:hypothetical protein